MWFHVDPKPLLRGTQRDITVNHLAEVGEHGWNAEDITVNHLAEVEGSTAGTEVLKVRAP